MTMLLPVTTKQTPKRSAVAETYYLEKRILNKLYNQYPHSHTKFVGCRCSLTLFFYIILSSWPWSFQAFIHIIITVIVCGL